MSDDDLNHYVSKRAITRSIVEGIPAKALCGALMRCSSQGAQAIPGQEAANRTLETCPECELFYSGLKTDEEADVKEPANV